MNTLVVVIFWLAVGYAILRLLMSIAIAIQIARGTYAEEGLSGALIAVGVQIFYGMFSIAKTAFFVVLFVLFLKWLS